MISFEKDFELASFCTLGCSDLSVDLLSAMENL